MKVRSSLAAAVARKRGNFESVRCAQQHSVDPAFALVSKVNNYTSNVMMKRARPPAVVRLLGTMHSFDEFSSGRFGISHGVDEVKYLERNNVVIARNNVSRICNRSSGSHKLLTQI